MNWKLVKTLSQTEATQWEELVEVSLGQNIHVSRIKGFSLAREALRSLLISYDLRPDISDLKIIDYHYLAKWPQFVLSLSHTKEAGAAVIADRGEYRSIGIDIEIETREVKENILERISHPADGPGLRNIELWCAKEAAFKCLMNSQKFEKPIEFSQIQILKDRWLHSPSGSSGACSFFSCEDHLVALAFLKN